MSGHSANALWNEQGDVQKGLPADDATGEEIALLDT